MNDRAIQYRGLSCAAWGYFFLNFNIHIGTISILPSFIGFLLLLRAILFLSEERRDLLLLRPLCIFLAAFGAADWFLSIFGQGLNGHFLFLDLLVMVANLYFHFQFLTDMAALAETCREGGAVPRRLRRYRTAYILLYTATEVSYILSKSRIFPWFWQNMLILLLLACGAVSLFIMVTLFLLKRRFLKMLAGI